MPSTHQVAESQAMSCDRLQEHKSQFDMTGKLPPLVGILRMQVLALTLSYRTAYTGTRTHIVSEAEPFAGLLEGVSRLRPGN